MTGYVFNAAGAYTSFGAGGGNMTPAMPAFNIGDLLLLDTAVNSISIAPPTISGWTRLSINTSAQCAALYARIAQSGDTSPTFQWDAGHQTYSRISSFTGVVYTDLTTIVATSNERATSTTGAIAVNATSAPSVANCLVLRGGRCLKTATNNGHTFNDWTTDTGVYTKVGGTQVVQNGNALAGGLWFWQQTTAAATSADGANLSTADAAGNSQGYTVVLKSQAAAIVVPTRSLLGVGT